MHIRTDQIKEDGLTLEFEEKADVFPVLAEIITRGECQFVAPIKTALRAIRIGDMIEVTGRIDTQIRLPCGRCLEEYEIPLKSRVDLTYVQRIPDAPEDEPLEEIELKAADMGLTHFQGENIDLRDGIQEQVILAIPIKALCRENCKGLCASCGHDLNEGDCGCGRQPTNDKFAVLKNLKLQT